MAKKGKDTRKKDLEDKELENKEQTPSAEPSESSQETEKILKTIEELIKRVMEDFGFYYDENDEDDESDEKDSSDKPKKKAKPKKAKKPKEKKLKKITSIETEVLRAIKGQDHQVRQVITGIYRAKTFKSIKSNMLIVGKSGTGKTATIEQIARILDIPYTIEDATKYTKEGYVGASVEDMLYHLWENAGWNLEKAEHGLLIIDEIDKKTGEIKNDVAGSEVLKSLLKIIEGTTLEIGNNGITSIAGGTRFDTSNLTVVFLGAFSGIEKIRDNRLNKKKIGFGDAQKKDEIKEKSRFLKKDFIEYGMTEEFMGRIDTIVEMNDMTKDILSLILKKSNLSIFRKYQNELKAQGIKLLYNSKLFELIAEKSLSVDTGARELSNTVNRIFENIIYDVLANPGQFTTCKLSLDIVNDNTQYVLS